YRPHLFQLTAKSDGTLRSLLIRLGIAGACAGNTMLIAVSLYQGYFTGIEQHFEVFLRWMSLVITLPSVFFAATPFYQAAWAGLRFGRLHIDLPISLGIVFGFTASCYNTAVGSAHVYFDSVCMLIFLLLIGRFLQLKALHRAREAAELMPSLLPLTAKRIESNVTKEVLLSGISPGDRILVGPGEVVPVDGTLEGKHAELDLSFISGESRAIERTHGDSVFAGSRNLGLEFSMKVLAVSHQTRLGKLLTVVQDAAQHKAQVVKLTDRLTGYFVSAVLFFASLTFAIWIGDSFEAALDHTLAFLVVTCPCALGLAAPVALSVALARAASKNMIIRSEEALQKLAEARLFFFDKTGTLTQPGLDLNNIWLRQASEWIPFGELNPDLQNKIIAVVRGLEAEIEHPHAEILRQSLAGNNHSEVRFKKRRFLHGKGVEGEASNGEIWRIGSLGWYREFGVEELNMPAQVSENFSPLLLTLNQRPIAIMGIGEVLKVGSKELLKLLRNNGSEIHLLSGDRINRVVVAAKLLGIEENRLHGELLPEDKA
ncbi:MAG: HAD-IC family P-type ATPase, partial [Bdellovibrionales bacterium]|nr:HAD-IC family P-type ATPase [Bdellovibrionales bacterium]